MELSYFELLWFLMVYSFLGWALEVAAFSVASGKFVNRGFLNLPFALPYGITAVLVMLTLPELNGHPLAQILLTAILFRLVWAVSDHLVRRMSGSEPHQKRYKPLHILCITLAIALGYYIQYLLVQPAILLAFALIPDWLIHLGGSLFGLAVLLDFLCVRYALRGRHRTRERTNSLGQTMSDRIWKRLNRAYPGLEETGVESHVFAQGLCFDKLFWVFLVSSILGAGIEMVFCRLTGGVWMNRSSLLYGPFSVVWGLGAVLLTIVLERLSDKPDRHVFLAGCIIGGAYEYLCSVFTEYVFGTVFWDYSHMALNLGGRINLLYCIFWGLLAVLWLRVLYPPMEQAIERLPVIFGKVLTWALIVLMVLNATLTSAAMLRYTTRQTSPEPSNFVDAYLDDRYPDDYMEARWPNMILTE